jgi:two-component system, sporulation sensor kinase D
MTVKCVKDQLKQVILNITKNAFESIPIEAQGIVRADLHSSGNWCTLTITDNGKGISKSELKKIFNPFYTSKDTGTGLGLVVCKRIIESFGGSIDISSMESVGTTVQICLPLAS